MACLFLVGKYHQKLSTLKIWKLLSNNIFPQLSWGVYEPWALDHSTCSNCTTVMKQLWRHSNTVLLRFLSKAVCLKQLQWKHKGDFRQQFSICFHVGTNRIYSLISRTFFYLEYGLYFACDSFAQHTQRDKVFPFSFATTPMTQMKKMKMTPMAIYYRTCRRTSFFRRRRFLRFWTINLTFLTFACKNQYFAVDGSRRVFTGEKVNWPAANSWITLDSRYMAKILLRLICGYG